MPRKHASKRWIARQNKDRYVKQARQNGLRSRAVFKLQQIVEEARLNLTGKVVVDLGAAPGSWSKYLVGVVGERGTVIALDKLSMTAIVGVTFIQGDFTTETTFNDLIVQLANKPVDFIFSDMAPNLSGIKIADQASMLLLANSVRDFTFQVLRAGGHLLIKIFHGAGTDHYIKSLRKHFKNVSIQKPEASRKESSEIYILASEFLANEILV